MKIKTITCHDVYNVGASLQAYALQEYLTKLGHDVEIIDYKPEYLSRHYSLTAVYNPKYQKPVLRELYILLKLPNRLKELKSAKKAAFDQFRNQYLRITTTRYTSNNQLKENCPEADLYFAGSDQIWNPLFQNGKDPAFFLDFVPVNKIRASYAASFAVEELNNQDRIKMKSFLERFDYISVRESSALKILESMQLTGSHVCDPVFLLDSDEWKKLLVRFEHQKRYLFVYDFDSNEEMHQKIREYAQKSGLDIVSAFPFEGGSYIKNLGPLEFLGIINNAELIISNSFHATAFSIIFHKPFLVFNRQENINTRMRDLINTFGIDNKCFVNSNAAFTVPKINWVLTDQNRTKFSDKSKGYINICLRHN